MGFESRMKARYSTGASLKTRQRERNRATYPQPLAAAIPIPGWRVWCAASEQA